MERRRNGSDRRLTASARIAMGAIDTMDDDMLAAYDHARVAMCSYGLLMTGRDLGPDVVLTQMTQVATQVFVGQLMPYWREP